MSTIFEKIVAGEIPCSKVWEDDAHLAFLDIRPTAVGHTLVIPKKATDYLFDMPADEYAGLMEAARVVSVKLKEKLGCERVVVMVFGYEVPHAHIHLIPTNSIGDLPFPQPNPEAIAQLESTADLLKPID